jgi:hypothetical protein
LVSERNELAEISSGSLSDLIVARESRRTERREPVNSQGDRRGTELPSGHMRRTPCRQSMSTKRRRIATAANPCS